MAKSDSQIFNLISKISNGIAKPNRYTVDISLPPIMGSGDTEKIKTLRILCERAEVPGALIATNEDKKFGPPRKMPYQYAYGDLTLGFICEDGMTARGFFDLWQSFIVDKTTFKCFYLDQYAAPEVNITLLSEEGKPIYHIICYQAYPVEVVPQTVGYAENDEYLKLEVKMAYYNWNFKIGEPDAFIGTGDPPPGAVSINYGSLQCLMETSQRAVNSYVNSIPGLVGDTLGSWWNAVDSAISNQIESTVDKVIDNVIDEAVDSMSTSAGALGRIGINPRGRKSRPRIVKI